MSPSPGVSSFDQRADDMAAAQRKSHQEAELAAFQERLRAAAAEQKRRKSLSEAPPTQTEISAGAPPARPRARKKSKTHAEMLADIAAAEGNEPAAAPAAPKQQAAAPNRKKTHAEMMAEWALEEAEKEAAAKREVAAAEEARIDAEIAHRQSTIIEVATPDAAAVAAKLNANVPKVEPAWKAQQRQRREADAARALAEQKERERKLAQLKTEAGLKKAGMNESGVSTPQNVSVAAGRNKFTEKGPTPGEIKRRGKTDEQKRAEAAAAQRAREDEQIRIAAVESERRKQQEIAKKQKEFFQNQMLPVEQTLKKLGAQTVGQRTKPRGKGSGTFVNGEWKLEQVSARAARSSVAAGYFPNARDDDYDV